MTHTAFDKRHQQQGYRRLIAIRCDCGQPATHQIQVEQYSSLDRLRIVTLALCESCYQLMLAEDRGIRRAW